MVRMCLYNQYQAVFSPTIILAKNRPGDEARIYGDVWGCIGMCQVCGNVGYVGMCGGIWGVCGWCKDVWVVCRDVWGYVGYMGGVWVVVGMWGCVCGWCVGMCEGMWGIWGVCGWW